MTTGTQVNKEVDRGWYASLHPTSCASWIRKTVCTLRLVHVHSGRSADGRKDAAPNIEAGGSTDTRSGVHGFSLYENRPQNSLKGYLQH